MGSFKEDFCVHPGTKREVGKRLLRESRGEKMSFPREKMLFFITRSTEIAARCYSGRRMSTKIHPTSCHKQCKRAAAHALARHRHS